MNSTVQPNEEQTEQRNTLRWTPSCNNSSTVLVILSAPCVTSGGNKTQWGYGNSNSKQKSTSKVSPGFCPAWWRSSKKQGDGYYQACFHHHPPYSVFPANVVMPTGLALRCVRTFHSELLWPRNEDEEKNRKAFLQEPNTSCMTGTF